MNNILINEEVARLRWSCRRGMLELDLLLQRFLVEQYLHLSRAEQTLFKALLNCLDQDLFAWLLGSRLPADDQFLPLIKKIQVYAPLGTSAQTL